MLYAVDLIGAGAGCLLVYPGFLILIDAPVAIITVGGLAALAWCMSTQVSLVRLSTRRGVSILLHLFAL